MSRCTSSADQADDSRALCEGDQWRPLVEWPAIISRCHRSEWCGSSWIRANRSPNTVRASSNDTPCFRRFEADFAGSHVSRIVIRVKHTTPPFAAASDGLTLRITRGRRAPTRLRPEPPACTLIHAVVRQRRHCYSPQSTLFQSGSNSSLPKPDAIILLFGSQRSS